MGDVDLFKLFIERWTASEKQREDQLKAVCRELKRSRCASRRLMKELKGMQTNHTGALEKLDKIANAVWVLAGLITLEYVAPILGSGAVKSIAEAAFKRLWMLL